MKKKSYLKPSSKEDLSKISQLVAHAAQNNTGSKNISSQATIKLSSYIIELEMRICVA